MAQTASQFLGEPTASSFLDDAPSASDFLGAPVRQPDVYDRINADDAAFAARAAENTPEALGRQATLDVPAIAESTLIPTGTGVEIPASTARQIVRYGPRIGFPIAGATLLPTGIGTLPGAALLAGSGALGEATSEAGEIAMGERQRLSPSEIATNAALSAYLPARLPGIVSPLARAGIRTAEGAAIGAGGAVLEPVLRGELPDASNVGQGALFGGLMGLPFGAIEFANGRRFGSAQEGGVPTELDAVSRVRNPVLPQPTAIAPDELSAVGRTLREPVLPEATNVLPSELDVMRAASRDSSGFAEAAAMAGVTPEELANIQLARRMAGNAEGGVAPESEQLARLREAQLPPPTDFPPDEFAAISNVISPRIPAQTPGIPAELAAIAQARETPIMPVELPGVPDELAIMRNALNLAGAEQAGGARVNAASDEIQLRRLAERMAGKTPEQQLEVVKQEVALQGDTLTDNQQRAALEIQQNLESQIAARDAAEDAAKAAAEQQKAQANALAAAQQPPEVPKSTQILAESAKPPSIANVATEVATQTKQSPYALQTKLNDMTTAPTQQAAPAMQPEKAAAIQQSIANKDTEWVYTVQRMGDGSPGYVQVDAIDPKATGFDRNIVSSNPSDLRAAGANIPDVPDWVPQGRYTLEQINALIKNGPTEVRPSLSSLIERYDSGESTGLDILNDIEGIYESGEMPPKIRQAIDEYVSARESDYDEFGARSGLEETGEDKFIEAVRREARKEKRGRGVRNPKKQLATEETVDVSPIINAATEEESVRIGGSLMRKYNSLENMRAIQKAMQDYQPPKGEPKNAIPIRESGPQVLGEQAKEPQLNVELPRVGEGNAQPEVAAQAQEKAPLSEAQFMTANAPESPAAGGRPQANTKQASRMRQTRGSVGVQVLSPLAGGAGGAAYGATQGDTPEERIRNAIVYGAAGLALGGVGGIAARRFTEPPIRNYNTPTLKRVAQMLTPKDESVPLLKRISDGYNNFRYRFNTRYAPIGQAQRSLFKQAGREFVPGSYYDLERGFERVAGAPVQAEGEVELLQNILDKLPNKNVQDFDTYLVLSRIEDRLVKTSEENDVLLDAVGRARAEVDAAEAAVKANPTQRGFATLAARRAERDAAIAKLQKEYDRKRVGDWSISDARRGLAELEQAVGPDAYAKLQQAGREFQDVMKRTLQIQVDSGRLDPKLRDAILESNDFYAPFKVLRHYDENQGFVRGGGTNRIPSQEQLAKKITGIDDNDVRIGSPTSVAAEQVYKGYILAQKNMKMRQLATLARLDPSGEFVKPLGEGMDPRKGYEAVSYLQNGQSKRLEVARPIADALNGLNPNQSDIILNALGKFGGVFKLGATGMSIPFNIANAAVFDPLRLATISKYGFRGPQDFLYTMYEWPKALASSLRGNLGQYLGATPDALYEQWIKSGAANSTLARVMNPEAFTARLPKNAKLGDLVTETNFGAGTPLKVASLLSNTLEETTKLLGLQRAMRLEQLDKLPPAQRERKWDEIVTELRNYAGSPDFARSGVDMRALNIVMPFTNPRWQGFLADFSRLNPFRQGNAKDAGAAWARLGSLVALPSAGLMWYNLSTPENERDYFQIPKDERERYFHIPLYADAAGKPSLVDYGRGGYYFKNKDGAEIRGYRRIPKREFPALVANTMEDFVKYTKANDPESFAQMGANFVDNFANTASPVSLQGNTAEERVMSAASGVNPLIRVPVETAMNKNFFTGRDIVPESRQKASPELQFSDNTPDAYKQVANAMPDVLPETLRSPAKLQHITEGMTGGFVRQFATPRLSEGNPAGESSPLLDRFYRSERVENEKMVNDAKAAERARTDERITEQDVATKLAQLIESRPTPEAKQKVIADANAAGLLNPETFKYLKEELTDMQRGLTYEDRLVKRSYSIAGGYRAQYFLDRVSSLPVGQRNAYLQDQVKKGLLTKEVAAQMAATLSAK